MSQQHNTIREGDEYYCTDCGKRWGIDEDAPDCVDDEDLTLSLQHWLDSNAHLPKRGYLNRGDMYIEKSIVAEKVNEMQREIDVLTKRCEQLEKESIQ